MLAQEQLEEFKPWLISVVKTGSRTLPWITNPNDYDFIFYTQNIDNGQLLTKLFNMKEKECWGVSLLKPKFAPFAYEYHYMVNVYGDQKPNYDIFEHIAEYKLCLVKRGLNRENDGKKNWYHILTGIYLLDNGEYSLTEEQIININLCHDKQMTPEIYQYIQERLTTYSKEMI